VYLKITLILQKQMSAGMHRLFRLREETISPAVLGGEDMERLNMS
jgi:hypothetical protein